MNTDTPGSIVETWIDDYIISLQKNKPLRKRSVKGLCSAYNIPKKEARFVAEKFRTFESELISSIEETDPDFVEGWSYLSKTKQKKLLSYVTDIANEFEARSKIVRRKKKVTPEKIVKNVKYQKSLDKYSVESIDPVSIIGAKVLLAFNTKQNKVFYYESTDPDGFSFKGTTLQNYDPDLSFCKSAGRNIKRVVTDCSTGAKNYSLNKLNAINTKRLPVTDRINEITLLLRCFK